jgi:LlaJI restriction endonuclease.
VFAVHGWQAGKGTGIHMAKGFFRERKHYKLFEIAKEFRIGSEEARRLAGILKKYGVVKTVKASKPEYEDLSDQDIILTDVVENSTEVEYVFDFVGIVAVDEYVFKCYPKYISSTAEPQQQLKQVLKVIKKYNDKEQLIYLHNGEDDNRIFNRLAVSLHLLEDYFQYGVYTNQHEIIETNGEGEILWDKTINETFALIQNNRPYYAELQTRNTVDDDMDYIRRLHECVLSQCTAELKDIGVLELFDIAGVELTSAKLDDFGDVDHIKYRLEKEIQTQYITRKQIILKTIYAYVANEKTKQENLSFSLYGTNSFNLVWEKVCAVNFGSVLDKKICSLPLGLAPEYENKKDESLRNLIDRPVWHRNDPVAVDDQSDTLRPDLICIYPCNDRMDYCFGIYDAKYYNIDFEYKKDKWKVTGQPGVGDITKQYLYQLAYDDFIVKQGYRYIQNMFFCPQEEAEKDYGYVSMEMLHHMGNKSLENITVVKLCAGEMYDMYLSGKPIPQEEISNYIPGIGRQSVAGQNFANRMMAYLSRIMNPGQVAEKKLEMKEEKGKLIYPQQIQRELGAKIIYDAICSVAAGAFYGFDPYEKESGRMVAEDAGNSFQRCSQIADAALEIEKILKELPERELQDETSIKVILKQCFEEKNEISAMAGGNSLNRLTEKVVELIREVYL